MQTFTFKTNRIVFNYKVIISVKSSKMNGVHENETNTMFYQ